VAAFLGHAKPDTEDDQGQTRLSGHAAGNTDTRIGAHRLDTGARRLDTGARRLDTGARHLDTGARHLDTGACHLDTGACHHTLILKAWIQLPQRRRSILLHHLLKQKKEGYPFHIRGRRWFAALPRKLRQQTARSFHAAPSSTHPFSVVSISRNEPST
jgi:hypothetical protein